MADEQPGNGGYWRGAVDARLEAHRRELNELHSWKGQHEEKALEAERRLVNQIEDVCETGEHRTEELSREITDLKVKVAQFSAIGAVLGAIGGALLSAAIQKLF